MAEFEVLSSTPFVWVNAKRELAQSSFVTYRDEEGRIGTITIRKPEPSLADVKAAVEKRKKGA